MPRKRASSSSVDSDPTPAKQAKVTPKTRDRWSKVSGSRNAQNSYHSIIAKLGDEAYKFKPLSSVPGCDDDDNDNEDDDGGIWLGEDEVLDEVLDELDKKEEGEKAAKDKHSKLDGNIVVTNAGFQKFAITNVHGSLRDPDNFSMYTFNDHSSYGQIEVVQNLFLDYTDARANAHWGPQWAIIEATALYLNCGAAFPMYMCEDGPLVFATMDAVARMFLDGLARLARDKLLGPESPVKSVPFIIAVMLLLDQSSALFEDMRSDFGDAESLASAKPATAKKAAFNRCEWSNVVRHYAFAYGITKLPKLPGYKETEKDRPENAAAFQRFALPDPTDTDTDPWKWAAGLAKYRRANRKGKDIGGDQYDLTAWSSAERKAASFNGKDPLSKTDINALKAGKVLSVE